MQTTVPPVHNKMHNEIGHTGHRRTTKERDGKQKEGEVEEEEEEKKKNQMNKPETLQKSSQSVDEPSQKTVLSS